MPLINNIEILNYGVNKELSTMNNENIKAKRISFPMYDTPTGKIIGACLLGKPDMCNELVKEYMDKINWTQTIYK